MSGGGKGVWVAIALIGALVVAVIAAGAYWAAGSGRPMRDRAVNALTAGGVAFTAMAGLALTIMTFLSG